MQRTSASDTGFYDENQNRKTAKVRYAVESNEMNRGTFRPSQALTRSTVLPKALSREAVCLISADAALNQANSRKLRGKLPHIFCL